MSEHDKAEETMETEVTEEEETEKPLELGGYLIPENRPCAETPMDTFARDLSRGQAILMQGRPCEITGRTDSMASSGALASRHKISLMLIELFDKEHLDPVVARATEKLKRVNVARVRYTVLSIDGPKLEILTLQKQTPAPEEGAVSRFRISGGKVGDDLAPFFWLCEGEEVQEGRPHYSITLLVLEAVGRYQVIGFGIGDWPSLG